MDQFTIYNNYSLFNTFINIYIIIAFNIARTKPCKLSTTLLQIQPHNVLALCKYPTCTQHCNLIIVDFEILKTYEIWMTCLTLLPQHYILDSPFYIPSSPNPKQWPYNFDDSKIVKT
jgi:hypothetical protein